VSDTAKHKPSERHAVDEVLKSLQDLIRNEALEDGKPKAAPAPPADPSAPRKRGRPRKIVIPDAAATPSHPRRRSSANLAEELNSVLASLNDLVNTDLNGSAAPARKSPPAAATEPPKPMADDLQAAAEALIADNTVNEDREGDVTELSLEDLAEEIDAAPPPSEEPAGDVEEIVVAAPPPDEPEDDLVELSIGAEAPDTRPAAPVERKESAKPATATASASPKQQLELKVIEPGEWKESETAEPETARKPNAPAGKSKLKTEAPTAPQKPKAITVAPATGKVAPAPAPTGKSKLKIEEPPVSKKPEANNALPTPDNKTLAKPAPAAVAAKPAEPIAKKTSPPVPEHDQETIELDVPDAITDLVVSDDAITESVSASPADETKSAKSKPGNTAPPDDDLELELTLEDPTRRAPPAAPVVDHEREKELHRLGLAEIDFSQVPEADSSQFAAFASSVQSSDDPHSPASIEFDSGNSRPTNPSGQSAELSMDDNIPLLEDEVTPAARPPALDPRQARELAVRAIAKLNIELRKAGEQGLAVKTIQRLQALLREELEKAGLTGENKRSKK